MRKNKPVIRGVFIDPYKTIVEDIEFEIPRNGYVSEIIRKFCKCGSFDIVQLKNTDRLFIDEDGLEKSTWATRFFEIAGEGAPVIAHCGLILNYDTNDEIWHSKFDADYYRPAIRFSSFFSNNVSVPEWLCLESK